MLSYLDYRDFPVSEEFPHCEPQHVSSEGERDDAQFWISRTCEGFPADPLSGNGAGGRTGGTPHRHLVVVLGGLVQGQQSS